MSAPSFIPGGWVRLLLIVIPLVTASTWLVAMGVTMIGFDRAEREAKAAMAMPQGGDASRLDLMGDRLLTWRDEMGLRYLARRAYRAFEREQRPLSLTALPNATAVVEVSPADGWGWIDVARAARLAPAGAAVSEPALDMALLVAPFEGLQAEYRIRLVVATWSQASEEHRRRTGREVAWLLKAPGPFRDASWRRIRTSLTPEIGQEVDAYILAYDPAYRPWR